MSCSCNDKNLTPYSDCFNACNEENECDTIECVDACKDECDADPEAYASSSPGIVARRQPPKQNSVQSYKPAAPGSYEAFRQHLVRSGAVRR